VAKKSENQPLRNIGPTVLVPMMCYCTFKPHPHFHKTSDIEAEPWNWDSTHKFWNESVKVNKPGNDPAKTTHRKNHRATKKT
jgi:hypothetical protein